MFASCGGGQALRLLDDPVQRAVRVAEDDAVALRAHPPGARECPSARPRAAARSARPIRSSPLSTITRSAVTFPLHAIERVAGAARLGLPHRGPVADVGLLRQILLDLLGEVVDDHDEPIDRRQGADDPVEDRPALHRQQRLGRGFGVRPEAGALAGGEDDRVHIGCLRKTRGFPVELAVIRPNAQTRQFAKTSEPRKPGRSM